MARNAIPDDVEVLQRRLKEAEDALRAIRSGEVDAVVVSGPNGDQVYVIKGAEETYRRFVENMSEGALTVLADGTISFGNQRFAELLKIPLDRVIGASLERFAGPDSGPPLRLLLEQARRAQPRGEVSFPCPDGGTLWAELSLSPFAQQEFPGVSVVVKDITGPKRAEAEIKR